MPTRGTSAWKWPGREKESLRKGAGEPVTMAERRTAYEIYWEILVYCRTPRAFTAIIGRCDLNSKTGQEYLGFLVGRGFLSVKKDGERSTYLATDRGGPIHRPLYPGPVPGAFRQGAGVPGITAGDHPAAFFGAGTGRPGIPDRGRRIVATFTRPKHTRKGYFFLKSRSRTWDRYDTIPSIYQQFLPDLCL